MPYFAREAKSNIIYHSNRITPENGLKNAKIMTIQEIRDLIAKKIAGQGTQVDVGGGLAAILNGILDLILAAMRDIPDAGSITDEAQEITQDEYEMVFKHPIFSYTRYEPRLGVVCSDKQLVGDLLSGLGAEKGVFYINYIEYFNNGTVNGYNGVLFYLLDDKYYKVAIEY